MRNVWIRLVVVGLLTSVSLCFITHVSYSGEVFAFLYDCTEARDTVLVIGTIFYDYTDEGRRYTIELYSHNADVMHEEGQFSFFIGGFVAKQHSLSAMLDEIDEIRDELREKWPSLPPFPLADRWGLCIVRPTWDTENLIARVEIIQDGKVVGVYPLSPIDLED